jgi:RimJ/RimL family protein N-acetyltransferase
MALVDSWLNGLKKAPLLESGRLFMRPMCAGDLSFIHENMNDKRISYNLSYTPHPYTVEMAENWMKNIDYGMSHANCCYWAVCEKETKAPIGSMGISIFKEQEGAEMHYWINADHWNRGYCTESSKRMIVHVFDILNAHRLAITHRENNLPSKKVIEKCGFVYEGMQRDGLKRFGKFENVICYSMLRDDYKKLKSQNVFSY